MDIQDNWENKELQLNYDYTEYDPEVIFLGTGSMIPLP